MLAKDEQTCPALSKNGNFFAAGALSTYLVEINKREDIRVAIQAVGAPEKQRQQDMDALRHDFAAPAPTSAQAWVEVPHEFIDEFFHAETAPVRTRAGERRPALGLAICAAVIALFWGSAAAAAILIL
jgi:hypothetical protein